MDRKFEANKIEAGVYEYRGFDIWRNAMTCLWCVNGPRGGSFRTLKLAKTHIDRVIKYNTGTPRGL